MVGTWRGRAAMVVEGMASHAKRHCRNQSGPLFVDTSCIDCGTCSRMAPAVFAHDEATPNAFVRAQPRGPAEWLAAMRALVSCPVGAIGTCRPADVSSAAASLPLEIAPGIYDCGFACPSTQGAAAWLVVRPEGNILVDSPRACPQLLHRIDELGGVATMFLTHRDDVGEHEAFRQRYGCERVMHVADACFEVERPIEDDDVVPLADDLLVVPVPGHTRGSLALLVGGTYLFTGDHLWADRQGQLSASRCLCWWSWAAQCASMTRLRQLDFTWVLPGHGYPFRAESPGHMRTALDHLIRKMGCCLTAKR